MSLALLDSTNRTLPHFAALVYNDTVLRQYNTSTLRTLNLTAALAALSRTNLTGGPKAAAAWWRPEPGRGGGGAANLPTAPTQNASRFDVPGSRGPIHDVRHYASEAGGVAAPFPNTSGNSDTWRDGTGPTDPHASTYPDSSLNPNPDYHSEPNLSDAGPSLFENVPFNFSRLNSTIYSALENSSLANAALARVEGATSQGFNASQALGDAAVTGGAQAIQDRLASAAVLQTSDGMGLRAALTILHNTSRQAPSPLPRSFARSLPPYLARSHVVARTHPLPLTRSEARQLELVLTFMAALFVLVPFCYLAATCAVFVVRERAVKAKHLQLVSGASVLAYWTATYVWDLLCHLAIVVITMAVFLAYRDRAFVGSLVKALAAMLLLSLFGVAVIPLSYCYSFAFASHANAQVAIAGLHFLSGFVTVVASLIMANIAKTKALNKVLVHIYRLFPPFNFGTALINLSAMDLARAFTGANGNPFAWEVTGRELAYLAVESVVYFVLVLAMDLDIVPTAWLRAQRLAHAVLALARPSKYRHLGADGDDTWLDEDADVAAERKRVSSGVADSDALVVKSLRKVYAGGNGRDMHRPAVGDLCLGVPAGQCFGFLGVNGAGKTTTLSILTGDIRPTSGDAFVNGASVRTSLPAVQRQIGYCPQFDPLLDLMTAREHLRLFARLKGVDEEEVEDAVQDVISAVGLEAHADRCAGTYSGGNKRKLSLAIALVGDAAVVLLDEPSSGMDPVARRAMWQIITRVASERGASIVLTTHSMEECEALCSRVGLMAAGRLACLGSLQHLKSRFGEGYYLELRTRGGEESERQVDRFLRSTFLGAELEEQHMGRARYRLPQKDLSLSKVFRAIEEAKGGLGIEDYSVSQSTLEQVFLSFVKTKEKALKQQVQVEVQRVRVRTTSLGLLVARC
eukprot:jgi/Mesen1/1338/ME000013S00825